MAITNVQLLNDIRSNSSDFYKDRIPQATKDNLAKVGTEITKFEVTRNEFLDVLVNRIALQEVKTRLIENKLAVLKKSRLPFGNTIQEIIANPAISKKYDMASTDLLKVVPPDVKALYYSVNRKEKYVVTIYDDTIQEAVLEQAKMSELIQMIITTLFSGDNLDEYILTKQLISTAQTSGHVVTELLTYDPNTMTEAQAKEFVKKLKTDSGLMTYARKDFNSYAKIKPVEDKGADLITYTPKSEQIILMDERVFNNISVDVWASLFNWTKAEVDTRIITVDDFNDAPILAMVVDSAWFNIRDTKFRTTSMFNGDTLSTTYWLHHWQMLRYSMFANAKTYTYTVTP